MNRSARRIPDRSMSRRPWAAGRVRRTVPPPTSVCCCCGCRCHCCSSVQAHLVLVEKADVPFKYQYIDLFNGQSLQPPFLKVNPKGRIY